MITEQVLVNKHYDTQFDFAEDFPKMLNQNYVLSNINFKKDTKDNFTAQYISRPTVEETVEKEGDSIVRTDDINTNN